MIINETIINEIFLQNEGALSEVFIKKHGWCSIPIRDFPTEEDCKHLSSAFSIFSGKDIFYVNNKLRNGKLNIEYKQQNDFLLEDYLIKNFGFCCMFLSNNLNGLLFQEIDFFIIAGKKEFVEKAYPFSFSKAKDLYFSGMKDLNAYGQKYLKKYWFKYAVE